MTGGPGNARNDRRHFWRSLLDGGAQVVRSASFYPLTGLYLATIAVLIGRMQNRLDFAEAVLILLGFTLLALLASVHREVVNTTVVLSEQRAQLIKRIDELALLLAKHRCPVPPSTQMEDEAREQAAAEDPEQTALGTPATTSGPDT